MELSGLSWDSVNELLFQAKLYGSKSTGPVWCSVKPTTTPDKPAVKQTAADNSSVELCVWG